MSDGTGPPEKERPQRVTNPPRPNQQSSTTTASHHQEAEGSFQSNGATRQCRHNTRFMRHADAWREGFRRGAIDALQIAMREVDDPDVWLVLDRLAERYRARDEFGLAS